MSRCAARTCRQRESAVKEPFLDSTRAPNLLFRWNRHFRGNLQPRTCRLEEGGGRGCTDRTDAFRSRRRRPSRNGVSPHYIDSSFIDFVSSERERGTPMPTPATPICSLLIDANWPGLFDLYFFFAMKRNSLRQLRFFDAGYLPYSHCCYAMPWPQFYLMRNIVDSRIWKSNNSREASVFLVEWKKMEFLLLLWLCIALLHLWIPCWKSSINLFFKSSQNSSRIPTFHHNGLFHLFLLKRSEYRLNNVESLPPPQFPRHQSVVDVWLGYSINGASLISCWRKPPAPLSYIFSCRNPSIFFIEEDVVISGVIPDSDRFFENLIIPFIHWKFAISGFTISFCRGWYCSHSKGLSRAK